MHRAAVLIGRSQARRAGSWFVKFALHHFHSLVGSDHCDIAMVGTRAWHEGLGSEAKLALGGTAQMYEQGATELIHDITRAGMLCTTRLQLLAH